MIGVRGPNSLRVAGDGGPAVRAWEEEAAEKATGSFSGIFFFWFFFPYLPSCGLGSRSLAESSQLLLATAYTLHRASPTLAQLHSFPALLAHNPLQTSLHSLQFANNKKTKVQPKPLAFPDSGFLARLYLRECLIHTLDLKKYFFHDHQSSIFAIEDLPGRRRRWVDCRRSPPKTGTETRQRVTSYTGSRSRSLRGKLETFPWAQGGPCDHAEVAGKPRLWPSGMRCESGVDRTRPQSALLGGAPRPARRTARVSMQVPSASAQVPFRSPLYLLKVQAPSISRRATRGSLPAQSPAAQCRRSACASDAASFLSRSPTKWGRAEGRDPKAHRK